MLGMRWVTGVLTGLRLMAVLGVVVVAMAVLILNAPAVERETSIASAAPTSSPALLGTDPVPLRLASRVSAAMRTHGCSTRHAPRPDTNWSVLVIIEDTVRLVDFDRGWSIYTGSREGQFVALCAAIVRN